MASRLAGSSTFIMIFWPEESRAYFATSPATWVNGLGVPPSVFHCHTCHASSVRVLIRYQMNRLSLDHCGCSLIHQLQASKVDISASGQTLETLDASLELLRIFYRSRHSELPKGDVEAVRQRIFNAAA